MPSASPQTEYDHYSNPVFQAVANSAIETLEAAASIVKGPNSSQQLADTARSKEQLAALALRVAEDAARAVLLWQGQGAAPTVSEGASAVGALVQTCVSLCTCSHKFTYGAGSSLKEALTKATVGIVLEACVPLVQGLVDPFAADLRHLLAQTWAACDRMKKVPLNNKAATFSELAKAMRGVLDTLREVDEMLHVPADDPVVKDAGSVDDDSCSPGASGRLPPVAEAEERPSMSGASDDSTTLRTGQERTGSFVLDGSTSPFARVSSEGGSMAALAAGLPHGFITAVHDIQLGECLVPGMEQLGNLHVNADSRRQDGIAAVDRAAGVAGANASTAEAPGSATAAHGEDASAIANDGGGSRGASATGAAVATAPVLDDNNGEGPNVDENDDGMFDFDATSLEPAERRVAEQAKVLMELAVRVMKRSSKVLLQGPPLEGPAALDSWNNTLFHISGLRIAVEELGAALYCPQDPDEVEGCASAAANNLELLLDEVPRPAEPSGGADIETAASNTASHTASEEAERVLTAFDRETLQLHRELETVHEALLTAVALLDQEADGDAATDQD